MAPVTLSRAIVMTSFAGGLMPLAASGRLAVRGRNGRVLVAANSVRDTARRAFARIPSAARTLLDHGQAQRELLLQHGLAERLLDDLAATVGEYEAALDEAREGRRDHVGASAELEAVSNDVMELVELLDGLNRYRFGRDAELMAAWQSARNVVGPSREADGTKTEVKPAA